MECLGCFLFGMGMILASSHIMLHDVGASVCSCVGYMSSRGPGYLRCLMLILSVNVELILMCLMASWTYHNYGELLNIILLFCNWVGLLCLCQNLEWMFLRYYIHSNVYNIFIICHENVMGLVNNTNIDFLLLKGLFLLQSYHKQKPFTVYDKKRQKHKYVLLP